MIKTPYIIFIILALSGCASGSERSANFCQGQGFTPGTQEYLNCLNLWYANQQKSLQMMQQGLQMMGGH